MKLPRTHARLERAQMHHREFGRIWNEFLTGGEALPLYDSRVIEATRMEHQPYLPSVSVDPAGRGAIHVAPIDLPREELALEFGEFLYQLRAALDSLVYETAIHVSGEDPPPNAEELEFPIRPSQASFDNAARKIAPLAHHHRVWIEEFQPYHAEYATEGLRLTAETLEVINDLARKDRHRGLRVIASWGSNKVPEIALPAGTSLEWLKVTEDGPLEHEGEIATFQIRNWTPGLEMHANPNLMIDVTVEDVPAPTSDEDTLFKRTRIWWAVVSLLIDGFEDSLDGDPRRLA